MQDFYPSLVPGTFYHVFNRGNNRENLFYKPANAVYFLKKYAKYLSPVLETYAYCLLPNHFHMVIRVKTLEELAPDVPGFSNLERLPERKGLSKLARRNGISSLELPAERKDESAMAQYIGDTVSEQFRLLFMSYAKAINVQEKRVGSLFQKNFKRLPVESPDYLKTLVLYVHANPQLHRLCKDFRDWPNSSYSTFLCQKPTQLKREAVLEWFGGVSGFETQHAGYIDWKTANYWAIED